MKDIQSVLRNYMSFKPKVNPSRERLLQAYYSFTDRRQDPCFTKVESEDLEVLDYCDYFPGDKWNGPSLVLYAPDLSINKPELEPFCNFPMHVLKDSAYTYYGMKMNILAYLLDRPVENLIVFYDGNKKFNVLVKPVYAEIILSHHKNHFAKKPLVTPLVKVQQKLFIN